MRQLFSVAAQLSTLQWLRVIPSVAGLVAWAIQKTWPPSTPKAPIHSSLSTSFQGDPVAAAVPASAVGGGVVA
jgi:hypothetical protein